MVAGPASPRRKNRCRCARTACVSIALDALTARRLLHQIVELHHRFGALEAARVAHDLLMRVAATIALDVGLGLPFRVRDELTSVAAAQKLLGDAALLLDHERRAFFLPHPL